MAILCFFVFAFFALQTFHFHLNLICIVISKGRWTYNFHFAPSLSNFALVSPYGVFGQLSHLVHRFTKKKKTIGNAPRSENTKIIIIDLRCHFYLFFMLRACNKRNHWALLHTLMGKSIVRVWRCFCFFFSHVHVQCYFPGSKMQNKVNAWINRTCCIQVEWTLDGDRYFADKFIPTKYERHKVIIGHIYAWNIFIFFAFYWKNK